MGDPTTWDRRAPPLSSATEGRAESSVRYRDQAVFGGATFEFFDARLLLLAGLRLTDTESEQVLPVGNAARLAFNTNQLTPQYGVLYELLPDVSLFATYAESFVHNGEMLSVRNVGTVAAEPTRGRGFDVGAKAELFGGRLTGTVTVFDVHSSNILNDISELDPSTGQQLFSRVQSGEQRSRGIELDATLTPIDSWQAYLSYSYNHARTLEFSGRDAAILAGGEATPGYKEAFLFHNAPLQMSAPHLANLWTRFDVPSGPLVGVYVAAGTHLVFEQTLLPDTPATHRQTYALFNALAGYTLALHSRLRSSVELYGKNLGNREYRPSQSSRSRPREVGVMLTLRY